MNFSQAPVGAKYGEWKATPVSAEIVEKPGSQPPEVPVTFSIVVPTRDRVTLLEQSLSSLRLQKYQHLEIVVADNPTIEEKSAKDVCDAFPELPIKYVRPSSALGMVENWNFGLQACSGDFVLFLTDKMFLLPGVLAIVASATKEAKDVDLVSWPFDVYTPDNYQHYLGPGRYFRSRLSGQNFETADWAFFEPRAELEKRYRAPDSRINQSPRDYAIGKILYGVYSRALIDQIVARHGKLFWEGSPDYTSMILALGTAVKGIELNASGVVALNTDFSNGELNAKSDERILQGLNRRGSEGSEILNSMVVPGLYSSMHAVVSADYVRMGKKLEGRYELRVQNWVLHCLSDLTRPDRSWASGKVRQAQFRLLNRFATRLTIMGKVRFFLKRLELGWRDLDSEIIKRVPGWIRLVLVKFRLARREPMSPYSAVTSHPSLFVALKEEKRGSLSGAA